MSPNIIPNLSPVQFDFSQIDSAEAEEIARLEQLMLDREDYYQMGCSY
jgi:hypothetical protein